jgi:hypothetical protein
MSICSSKKYFRLASARHIMEDKGGSVGMAGKGRGERKGRGKKGREGARRVSLQTQNPNSAYVVDHLLGCAKQLSHVKGWHED